MMLATRVTCQTSGDEAVRLIEQPAKTPLNQVRVSARLGYNITARLDNVGIPASQSFPQPPPPRDPNQHFVSATGVGYADGYVGIDESGNLPGPGETDPRSFYWGYANANQIAGGALLLTHSSSGTIFGGFKNDPQAGVEINYSRQLGVSDNSTWGIEGGLTYTSLDLNSRGIVDPRVLSVDAFPLGGVVPPAAPYAGTYEPGPFGSPSIVATPTRYPVNMEASFDASIYGLKLGPYFQFPVTKRLAFALNGGFALLLSETEFTIRQSVAVASPLNYTSTLKSSEFVALPGAYVGGRLLLTVSDSVNVFTGLEYESTGHHSQTLGSKRINLDFWNSVYWTFGVSYSF